MADAFVPRAWHRALLTEQTLGDHRCAGMSGSTLHINSQPLTTALRSRRCRDQLHLRMRVTVAQGNELAPLTLVGAQADVRDEPCSRWGAHTCSPGDWTLPSGACL